MFSCNLPPALFGRMTGIFLRATVVTRGWNGYRNKSQHRKSTLEKKILPPFQQGFEPATFQSRVRCSNHWAIPAPFKSTGTVPALEQPPWNCPGCICRRFLSVPDQVCSSQWSAADPTPSVPSSECQTTGPGLLRDRQHTIKMISLLCQLS